jgi:hypothetical protein
VRRYASQDSEMLDLVLVRHGTPVSTRAPISTGTIDVAASVELTPSGDAQRTGAHSLTQSLRENQPDDWQRGFRGLVDRIRSRVPVGLEDQLDTDINSAISAVRRARRAGGS